MAGSRCGREAQMDAGPVPTHIPWLPDMLGSQLAPSLRGEDLVACGDLCTFPLPICPLAPSPRGNLWRPVCATFPVPICPRPHPTLRLAGPRSKLSAPSARESQLIPAYPHSHLGLYSMCCVSQGRSSRWGLPSRLVPGLPQGGGWLPAGPRGRPPRCSAAGGRTGGSRPTTGGERVWLAS